MDVGLFHACAIRDNGKVACWGHNKSGQASPPRGEFKQVSAGNRFTCGIRTDNTLACWGAEYYEERSDTLFGRGSRRRTDYGWTDPPEGTFIAVSVGQWHACAIQTDRRLSCWGANHWPSQYVFRHRADHLGQAVPPASNQ